ncbi:hypothetical protein GCM10011529_01070 [Polymorphobacter glacialis]|uniref:Uncharacterized protein n=1 Tax=Sandarakinorhabdus glacialis TaxID=1614636 RepID=A0A916ZHL9_9SPHN|nr:hypothetical protein [Polymorphobacter glacialis]GGD98770.1 hypothetical protein GCM10011529_01070 [Polymorphobacter glacialis]
MSSLALARGLGAAAVVAAEGAVIAARERLATRAAAALPDAAIDVGSDAVRVTGPGLVARAFGSRRRAADPRLLGLVRGDGA